LAARNSRQAGFFSHPNPLVRAKKNPESPEADGPDPIRADSRSPKQKNPTDPFGSLGLPSQGQTNVTGGSGNNLRSEFYFPIAVRQKIKHLLRGTARLHLRE
jgi:hypothetical protein